MSFRAALVPVRVTPATVWLFVSLSDGETVGWGEATLDKQESLVAACFNLLPDDLTRCDLKRLRFDSLPHAAVSSALLQAQVDLVARRAGEPLGVHLGGRAHAQVGVYANINRRTLDRSPQGMAFSAKCALEQGFEAIKIAPFDEVRPTMARAEMTGAMAHGLARIAAVRSQIGQRRLMVDCHWRFDVVGAKALIAACGPFDLHWIECPIAESEDHISDLVALRRCANAAGMRLAGLETKIKRGGFAPYLTAGAYDVMMPDVKYCGGPDEMLAIAADMDRHGVEFSPHNPTGPICHAHSLHVCAAVPQSDLLEMQFDETPMFDSLVHSLLPKPSEGCVTISGDCPGIGVSLVAPDAVVAP